jgi:hypothetical protein
VRGQHGSRAVEHTVGRHGRQRIGVDHDLTFPSGQQFGGKVGPVEA